MRDIREEWSPKTHPVRFLVFLIVVGLLAWCVGHFAGKAMADYAVGAPRVAAPASVYCDAGDKCSKGTAVHPHKWQKRHAKLFRQGKIEHHATPAKRLFVHPKVARKVFVNKIVRAMKNNPYAAQQVKQRYGPFGNRVSARESSLCFAYLCYAQRAYDDLMSHGGCTVAGAVSPITKLQCDMPDSWKKFDKKTAQVGGSVVLCGGAVGIGVLAAPESAGSSAVAATAIWGSLSCGWGFWSAVDPG